MKLNVANMSYNAILENKILQNISEFTVFCESTISRHFQVTVDCSHNQTLYPFVTMFTDEMQNLCDISSGSTLLTDVQFVDSKVSY